MIRIPWVSIKNAAWPYHVIRMGNSPGGMSIRLEPASRFSPGCWQSIITSRAEFCYHIRRTDHPTSGGRETTGRRPALDRFRVETRETHPMDRRNFLLATAGAGTATAIVSTRSSAFTALPPDSGSSGDGTWLTYAVNVEMTWTKIPFLDRIRKVKEAGFSHYEFWPWRGKDIDAILKLNRELGLTTAQFSASPVKGFGHGVTNPDPARREEFEEEIRTAVAVARKLGVKKICVVAGEEARGHSRDEQTSAVIAALKAGAKIVEPEGITIILEPLNILVNHPRHSSSTRRRPRRSSRPWARPT